MSRPKIRKLIAEIFQKGEYAADGRRAIKELAAFGEPAVREMLSALIKPPKTDLHPRDVWDSISSSFSEFARTVPDSLLKLLDKGAVDPGLIYWGLGSAKARPSLDALIAGLKHKNQYVRWLAAESLIRRRDKRAVPALVKALGDRSTSVKSSVVSAMKSNRMYRTPEALPLLQRIVDNKMIRRQSPGLWREAQMLLQRMGPKRAK